MGKSALRRAVALVLVLGLAAAACGRDDESSSDGGSDTTEQGGGSTATTGDGTEQASGPATTDGCDGYEAAPGVTDASITLGSSYPQSGLYSSLSAMALGWQAQIDTVNEAGGIDGREIEVISKDDEYKPADTARNYQSLVEEDDVFALFSVIGTPNNLGIQPQQNAACVPNLFAATGTQLVSVPAEYPWTIGSIPSYPVEMAVWVEYLKANQPDAKVAFLYQNDDFGKGYYDSFTQLIEGTDITVVADTTYDPENPDVTSQIASLAGSDADALVLGVAAIACPSSLGARAEQAGWDPLTYISATCTSASLMSLAPPGSADGIISAFYLKDPVDPEWDDDPAMQEFREKGAAAGLSAEDLDNGIVGYGWTMGAVLAQTLQDAPELTREAVMNSAYHLDGLEVGLLLPGITITTNGVDDPYPIETMYIGSYNGEYWDLESEPMGFEGESGSFSPT